MKVFRRVDLKKLKVTWMVAPAVNTCGSAMAEQNHLLDGLSHHRVLRHNVLAVERSYFFFIVVLSLTQGGPAPAFFAPSVVVGGS